MWIRNSSRGAEQAARKAIICIYRSARGLTARIGPRWNWLGLAGLQPADVIQHHSIILVAGRVDEAGVAADVARSFSAKQENDGAIAVHAGGTD